MVDCPVDPTYLTPPLRTAEFEALFQLLKEATVCQDLSVVLNYFVDAVDVSVLPHLAEQFDVTGYKGWLLADTEEKQRDLIKNAIKIHRLAGTRAGVTKALATAGFTVTSYEENPGSFYDGTRLYDGTEDYLGRLWDRFYLSFATKPPADKATLIFELVNAWKPVRSTYLVPDILLQYDGTVAYDGTEIYDGYKD